MNTVTSDIQSSSNTDLESDRENEKGSKYIHLVSILEMDTNSDIHITSFSGYEF